MKKIGKLSLFVSSYFILFLILFIRELYLCYSKNWSDSCSLTFAIIYVIILIFSIISIVSFNSAYKISTVSTRKEKIVESVRGGSSEVISYLVTMIFPLLSIGAVSAIISTSSVGDIIFKAVELLVIILFLIILYTNTNLVMINPSLMFLGYKINKISYRDKEGEIEKEGILICKEGKLNKLKRFMFLDEIDNGVFII